MLLGGFSTMRTSHLLSFAAALGLSGAAAMSTARAETPEPSAIVAAYSDMALAIYGDALAGAKDLQTAIDAFLADPTDASLVAARDAWRKARVPYMQSEGYRFGNSVVDDWEGDVNSWPLDEGLIDYVDAASYGETSDENPLYTANVIANPKIRIGADEINATTITPDLLKKLTGADGVDANVATGYHAIEFLLWGQDLHGTGPGAGERPATDYSASACTHGNCDRRGAYLKAATDLLVADLQVMVDDWKSDGAARKLVTDKGPDGGLSTILTGLGSLSYGELAGERTKLGLLLHDPEEEHDCFSDNTHNSDFYDEVGMHAIWTGRYTRVDGSVIEGPSIRAYALTKAPEAAARVDAAFKTTGEKMQVLKDTADSGRMAYDQMIGADNPEGNQIVEDVVDSLVAQARAIEGAVSALGLTIEVEGSDSLDNPTAVVQ